MIPFHPRLVINYLTFAAYASPTHAVIIVITALARAASALIMAANHSDYLLPGKCGIERETRVSTLKVIFKSRKSTVDFLSKP